MRAIWCRRAEAELRAIHARIAQSAPAEADAGAEFIAHCTLKLERFPEKHSHNKTRQSNVYELSLTATPYPYRIRYRIEGDLTGILNVRHVREGL